MLLPLPFRQNRINFTFVDTTNRPNHHIVRAQCHFFKQSLSLINHVRHTCRTTSCNCIDSLHDSGRVFLNHHICSRCRRWGGVFSVRYDTVSLHLQPRTVLHVTAPYAIFRRILSASLCDAKPRRRRHRCRRRCFTTAAATLASLRRKSHIYCPRDIINIIAE